MLLKLSLKVPLEGVTLKSNTISQLCPPEVFPLAPDYVVGLCLRTMWDWKKKSMCHWVHWIMNYSLNLESSSVDKRNTETALRWKILMLIQNKYSQRELRWWIDSCSLFKLLFKCFYLFIIYGSILTRKSLHNVNAPSLWSAAIQRKEASPSSLHSSSSWWILHWE